MTCCRYSSRIWTKKPEQARKLRQRIRLILKWCQAHGYVKENVAGEQIDGALQPMPSVKEHHRSLSYTEVSKALDMMEESGASLSVKSCLRFVILTACRGAEARGARWSEFSTEKKLWIIPSSRMKTKQEHRVPLSDEAMKVLDQVRVLRRTPKDDSEFVFPSPVKHGRQFSAMAMPRLLGNVGLAADKCVVHGFRASFRTWAEECTNADFAVKELCLAHTIGKALVSTYTQTDLLQKRRGLMERWGDYLTMGPT